MKRKKFIIDGNNFSDLEGFYNEFEKVFLKDYPKEFEFGRNLDAFDDILYPDEKEKKYKWIIIWKNFDKSKKEIEPETLKTLVEIIQHHNKHIKFEVEK